MSHTNETANFHLPQFTADDKPDWLVDVNDAFQAIDTGMASTQSEAESASSVAQLAQTTAEGAAETAGQASSGVADLAALLETLQGTVNTITALIGNGVPTAGDHTIIGAANAIDATVNALIRVDAKSGGEVTVAANAVGNIEVNIEKDGYTPVAIATWSASATHNEDVNIYRAVFNTAKTKAILGVKNNNAASQDISAVFTILYVKNGLV